VIYEFDGDANRKVAEFEKIRILKIQPIDELLPTVEVAQLLEVVRNGMKDLTNASSIPTWR
jgi:hypothetical protein